MVSVMDNLKHSNFDSFPFAQWNIFKVFSFLYLELFQSVMVHSMEQKNTKCGEKNTWILGRETCTRRHGCSWWEWGMRRAWLDLWCCATDCGSHRPTLPLCLKISNFKAARASTSFWLWSSKVVVVATKIRLPFPWYHHNGYLLLDTI